MWRLTRLNSPQTSGWGIRIIVVTNNNTFHCRGPPVRFDIGFGVRPATSDKAFVLRASETRARHNRRPSRLSHSLGMRSPFLHLQDDPNAAHAGIRSEIEKEKKL